MTLLSSMCYSCSFLVQLFLATILFAPKIEKRDHFMVWCALEIPVMILLSGMAYYLLMGTESWILQNALFYGILFVLMIVTVTGLYQIRILDALDITTTGYIVQNLCSQFMQILFRKGTIKMMNQAIYAANGKNVLFGVLIGTFKSFPLMVVCYLLLYIAFQNKMNRTNYTEATRRKLLYISLLSLLCVLFVSSYRDTYAAESFALMFASRILSVLCCMLLLIMKTGILQLNSVEQETDTLRRLRVAEREQYEQKKETVELINIKCHDLRHQINLLEKQGTAPEQSGLNEMKKLIRIYDSSVKTGNETLDVILTERSFYCEKYGVRLSCIADGSKLSFMSVTDIGSLFGNALENAIHAVQKLNNPDDRIISLKVEEKGGMLLIRVENSYADALEFDGELPKTTKEDNGYHGFGLKSIRMVAERYGGVMRIQAGEQFVLTVLIPMQ